MHPYLETATQRPRNRSGAGQRGLEGAFAGRYDPSGLDQDDDVVPERPVQDVPFVQEDAAFIAGVAAAADLPQAGHAGPGANIELCRWAVMVFKFLRHDRTRTDQTHMPHKDIPELRQLVQAGAPQPFADAGDARIIAQFEGAAIFFIEVGVFLLPALPIFPRRRSPWCGISGSRMACHRGRRAGAA